MFDSSRQISFVLAALLLLSAGIVRVTHAMDADERTRVSRILDRLETAGADPLRLQAPRVEVPESVSELETRRSLVIARAIRTLESSKDTTLAVLDGDVLTPLSLARNYRHLGLPGRALRWYRGALTADQQNEYSETIRREMAGCVATWGDSARVMEVADRLLRRSSPERHSDALADLLDALEGLERGPEILSLVERMDALRPDSSPRLQLAVARFWLSEERLETAHARFATLLHHRERLPLDVAARTLQGLADSAAQRGDLSRAVSLYTLYQTRDTGRLSAWSTYRLGQLAVNDGRLRAAENHFRSICEREDDTPWREDACTQLAQTRQLIEIDEALQPYGLRLHMNRESAR